MLSLVAVVLLVVAGVGVAVAVGGGDDPADPEESRTSGASEPTGSTSSGTSTSTTPDPDEPVGPGLPEVGECRVLGLADVDKFVDETPPVACDAVGVTAQTIYVGRLDEREERQVGPIAAECFPALSRRLGVPVELVGSSLVDRIVYWPSDEQWEAGARWFRCDAAAIRRTDLLQLPVDLATVFDGGTVPLSGYRACLDSQNVKVSCADDSTAAFRFRSGTAITEPDTWPGDAGVRSIASRTCSDDPGWYATWPLADAWNAGIRYIDCWTPIG